MKNSGFFGKVFHITYIKRKIHLHKNRRRLKNKDFSLICCNCNGGHIYHDLGLRFTSPFINLRLNAENFLKLIENFDYYMSCDLVFDENNENTYPVGILGDLVIHFVHYANREIAFQKWNERKKRINKKNLFILFADRYGCTYEIMKKFDSLPYKNKILFTNKKNTGLKSCFYISGFDDLDSVGVCSEFMKDKPWLRYLDQFDYVKWFNEGK